MSIQKTKSKRGLQPATKAAFQLLMDGTISMCRIEEAGLKIDVPYLERAIKDTRLKIERMKQEIAESKEAKLWAKHYGDKMKMGSRTQLGHIIFDVLGHRRNPFIPNNNVAAFEHLRLPFTQNHFGIERLKKALVTNLLGIWKELDGDGYVHPNYSLYTAESYRPSSDSPNFQNLPVRNKEISEIVRSCVIPSNKDFELLEADYGTQEVRVSYCYNKDPKLLHDVLHGDMHSDRAMDLFMLTKEELGPTGSSTTGKDVRYAAKNGYVFAQFYGSYFALCAPALWDMISLLNLRRSDGVSLFEHLKSKGIKKLGTCDPEKGPKPGTFEWHVRSIDRKMWQETYTVYDQWKKDWWSLYQRQGGINTKTGFRQQGIFRRNQILCDAIQGSAFHCLLWTIIEIQKELIARKMRSRIICQIHDSMLFNAHKKERNDLIEMVHRIGTKKVAEHWKWIICPLSIEFEICEGSWFKKIPLDVSSII